MIWLARLLIVLGMLMLIAALGVVVWVVFQIGLGKVLSAPSIQVNLGWQGLLYFGSALTCLFAGLGLRRGLREK